MDTWRKMRPSARHAFAVSVVLCAIEALVLIPASVIVDWELFPYILGWVVVLAWSARRLWRSEVRRITVKEAIATMTGVPYTFGPPSIGAAGYPMLGLPMSGSNVITHLSIPYSQLGGKPQGFPSLRLSTIAQVDTIRAYRLVSLASDGGTIWMTSLAHPGILGPWGEAACLAGQSHEAPNENCTCGFYAMKPQKDGSLPLLPYGKMGVPVEVELSGKVIEHESGYRAQCQHIVRMLLPGGYCRGRLFCPNDVSAISLGAAYDFVTPLCANCSFVDGMSVDIGTLSRHLGVAMEWGPSLPDLTYP